MKSDFIKENDPSIFSKWWSGWQGKLSVQQQEQEQVQVQQEQQLVHIDEAGLEGLMLRAPSATMHVTTHAGSVMHHVGRWMLFGGGIFGLGLYEASLLARRPVPFKFAVKYAMENTVASLAWRSVSPINIVTAMGVSPKFLIEFHQTVAHARISLKIERVRVVRYALGLSAVVLQCLSLQKFDRARSNISNMTDTIYQKKISGKGEKVLRLTSFSSPMTLYSLKRHGEHISPIFIELQRGQGPDFFEFEKDNLLSDPKSDRKTLVVEADLTSVGEKSFKEIWRAFDEVTRMAYNTKFLRNIPSISVVTVVNGTEAHPKDLPSDISINSEVVKSALLERFCRSDSTTFDLRVVSHSDAIRPLLISRGILPMSPEQWRDAGSPTGYKHIFDGQVLEATMDSVSELVSSGQITNEEICVITNDVNDSTSYPVKILCESHVLDGILQKVREKIRAGVTKEGINSWLLQKFGSPLLITPTGCREDRHSFIRI